MKYRTGSQKIKDFEKYVTELDQGKFIGKLETSAITNEPILVKFRDLGFFVNAFDI